MKLKKRYWVLPKQGIIMVKKSIKIDYGKKQFTVNAEFLKRKTFSITVYPDQSIVARIPLRVDEDKAEKMLKKKARWINRKIEYFEKFQPLENSKNYMSGESFYYLGRQYRLNVIKSKNEEVKLKGKFFNLHTKAPSNKEKKKALLYEWYREHAIDYITRRIGLYSHKFKKKGIIPHEIRFRKMKRRWGSCSNRETITFNTELIRAPVHCIDYVIIHEFIHLRYMKHNREFYRTLEYMLPDWELRKERLDEVQIPE